MKFIDTGNLQLKPLTSLAAPEALGLPCFQVERHFYFL
jgi:hypothetical protein